MVYESIDHGNDVTCRHAVPVVLFLVFRKKGKCYCKKQIDHNFHGLHSYSPVILWKKIGQPATNCNRRFFNGFRLCKVPLLTYQKSQKIPVWEITKKRDLL